MGPIPSIFFFFFSFRWEHDGLQLEHNTQIQYGVTDSVIWRMPNVTGRRWFFVSDRKTQFNKVVCSLKWSFYSGIFFHHIAAKTHELLMPNIQKIAFYHQRPCASTTLCDKRLALQTTEYFTDGFLAVNIVRVYSTPRLVLFSLFLCRCQRRDLEKNLNIQSPICNKQVKRRNGFAAKYFYLWFSGPLLEKCHVRTLDCRIMYSQSAISNILYCTVHQK